MVSEPSSQFRNIASIILALSVVALFALTAYNYYQFRDHDLIPLIGGVLCLAVAVILRRSVKK